MHILCPMVGKLNPEVVVLAASCLKKSVQLCQNGSTIITGTMLMLPPPFFPKGRHRSKGKLNERGRSSAAMQIIETIKFYHII